MYVRLLLLSSTQHQPHNSFPEDLSTLHISQLFQTVSSVAASIIRQTPDGRKLTRLQNLEPAELPPSPLATSQLHLSLLSQHPLISEMSRRAVTTVGVVAAGGIGYYLYQAGGDAKTAQKIAERT